MSLTGTPLFNQLSVSARESMMGAFSLKAIGGVTAKVIQVTNGTEVKDFYADRTGRLLDVPVTGQTLRRWLGGETGQVTTWYDQSGRGNHMTCSHEDERPTVVLGDDGNYYIQSGPSYTPFDISANPTSGPVPYSNTKGFTVIWHHNTLGNNTDVCSCTDSSNTTRFGTFYGIYTSTFPDGSNASSVYRANGDTVTCTFDGTNRRMYTNGVLNSTQESTWTQSASTAHTIGSAGSNCRLYSVVMFDSVLSAADQALVENVPPVPSPAAVTGFVMSNSTATTIDLEWNASSGATLYTIVSSEPTTVTTSGTSWSYTGMSVYAYTFTITPSNGYGDGPPTVLSIPAFPDYAPAPYNEQLSATTTSIEFQWVDYIPERADSYKVYCYDAATYEVVYVQTCPLTPTHYTFTGLQTNYGYAFRLSSVNDRGEQTDPSSASLAMYTIPTVTGVSVSNPTQTTVDITWDTPTTNWGLNYVITSTPVTTTQETVNAPYTFTGLTSDTAYTFTVTPLVGPFNNIAGDPVTSGSISTLLPLPGTAPSMDANPTIVTATTMNLAWNEYVPEYATSFNVYAYSVIDGLIGFVNVPISSFSCTYTGLQPDTEYYFAVAGVNATGAGPQDGSPTVYTYTLSSPPYYRTYTGTIETISLAPGTYRFTMAGGSGPLRDPNVGGGRAFGEYTRDYTVTSPITIQYAIGQASPGDVGGAGGTYMYDLTNSQWLFVAGGAGTDDASPVPDDYVDPGNGSGGAAGSGGGSGAGVNSNGSDSTVSAGSGGLTFGNDATGGAGGSFGEPQMGGFGGGGGGTRVYDFVLPGEYAYYPGGGGGYTGGTTATNYDPGVNANWLSTPGTSYAISGAAAWGSNSSSGPGTAVTNGYINIIIP